MIDFKNPIPGLQTCPLKFSSAKFIIQNEAKIARFGVVASEVRTLKAITYRNFLRFQVGS